MKKYLMMLVLFMGLGHAGLALALTLDEAKSEGLVGEKLDGYIGAVSAAASDEVKSLVASTNEGRRKVYAELAQRNGIRPEAVGVLSAEKLQTAAPMGQYIQMPDGKWRKK